MRFDTAFFEKILIFKWKYVIICKKVSCLTDLLLRVEEIRKENGYEIYQIKNFPAYAVGRGDRFNIDRNYYGFYERKRHRHPAGKNYRTRY